MLHDVISEPTFLSILPIVVTLILSVATRNVILGLFAGIVTGVFLLVGFDPLQVMQKLVSDYLVVQVADRYNAGVIVLLAFIAGFVSLMEKSGGGPAFAARVTPFVRTREKSQIFAWMGGILLFFSDIGTALIVGPVFQSLFDKMKLSREKLAMIVDSTASPVAVLVPFIGWGIYSMSLIDKEIDVLPVGANSFDIFLSAIPFQFYAILAVVLIPWIALGGVDFGPMAKAEDTAKAGTGSEDQKPHDTMEVEASVYTHDSAGASFVFIPLLVLFSILLIILIPLGFPAQPVPGSIFRSALSTGYFFAAVALVLLMARAHVRPPLESIGLYLKGMNGVMQIAIILVLAWTLSVIGKDLGAPAYVSALIKGGISGWFLPAAIFLVGGVISFATGSSWGTFAVLFPLVIPAAVAVDAPLAVVVAAVLSGGLFGDHCSPISDSTILSSTGAGCDQFDHFRTQLPYALFNGFIALLGFVIAGAFPSPLLLMGTIVLQLGLIFLAIRLIKRRVEPA